MGVQGSRRGDIKRGVRARMGERERVSGRDMDKERSPKCLVSPGKWKCVSATVLLLQVE